MKKFDFALVDAFAEKPLTGNPCAVVIGADKLKVSEMLAIAKEMNQSETAFLMKSKSADLRARYFTPMEEIPLAGHPTIASIHLALELGIIKKKNSISLELQEGPIRIGLKNLKNNKILVQMHQRKPIFGEIHSASEVLPLFNLSTDDLLEGASIQTVSTGTPQLMIPLQTLASLKKIVINVRDYKIYKNKKKFFSPHFFCLEGATSKGHTFARHLGVPPDTFEDPFTGSASGGMAAYLWHHNFIKKSKFVAEQGHWMNRPGKAFVEIIGSKENIQSVCVAGTAITVLKGKLTI